MTTNREGTEDGARQGNEEKLAAVEASPLEAAPESQTDGQGTSFYNPALTGSGTILPDGTYGAPLPDPNLKRRNEDPNVTTDAEPVDAPKDSTVTKPATARTARKTTGS